MPETAHPSSRHLQTPPVPGTHPLPPSDFTVHSKPRLFLTGYRASAACPIPPAVEYEDRRDAEDAVRGLDGKNGWRVEFARASGPKTGGGYGGVSAGQGAVFLVFMFILLLRWVWWPCDGQVAI